MHVSITIAVRVGALFRLKELSMLENDLTKGLKATHEGVDVVRTAFLWDSEGNDIRIEAVGSNLRTMEHAQAHDLALQLEEAIYHIYYGLKEMSTTKGSIKTSVSAPSASLSRSVGRPVIK
jgi:hypothetical protein